MRSVSEVFRAKTLRLIKSRSVVRISNDTYFEHNNGLIMNRAALFKDMSDLNGWGYSFSFPNMRVAYFVNCDKNYSWYNLEPERMPNIRHICLATRYDGAILCRFPKRTNAWYHISRKHWKPNYQASDMSNIVLWDHEVLMQFIESLPYQKLQVITADRMRKRD